MNTLYKIRQKHTCYFEGYVKAESEEEAKKIGILCDEDSHCANQGLTTEVITIATEEESKANIS